MYFTFFLQLFLSFGLLIVYLLGSFPTFKYYDSALTIAGLAALMMLLHNYSVLTNMLALYISICRCPAQFCSCSVPIVQLCSTKAKGQVKMIMITCSYNFQVAKKNLHGALRCMALPLSSSSTNPLRNVHTPSLLSIHVQVCH